MANFDNGPARGVAYRIVALALALNGAIAFAVPAQSRPETNTHSGHSAAAQQVALHKACTGQGGRFELFWRYNDQGVQWGKVLSCSTSTGRITCQGNICRASRRVPRDRVTTADTKTEKNHGAGEFPADPVAFSAALVAISVD